MAWTAPRTWADGERWTVGRANVHWRDNIGWLARVGVDRWPAFTPLWSSASNPQPAYPEANLTCTYCMIGRTVFAEVRFAAGGGITSYGTGDYSYTLPVPAVAASRGGGGAILYDSSATEWYTAHLDIATANTFQLLTGGTTQTIVSPTSPFTWGTSDTITAWLTYQAAS